MPFNLPALRTSIQTAIANQPKGPQPPDPRMAGMADWMKQQRDADIASGQTLANQYFGAGNPDMAAILAARKEAALGTGPDKATELAREAGTQGINRQMQTAMRQFQGRLPGLGVQGGAAGAMAGMLGRDAMTQSKGLERDLALNELQRKQQALGDYEKSVTGERAGQLGTTFGVAGLGSQDRYGSLGYLTSKDFLDAARQAVYGRGDPVSAASKSMGKMDNTVGGFGIPGMGTFINF